MVNVKLNHKYMIARFEIIELCASRTIGIWLQYLNALCSNSKYQYLKPFNCVQTNELWFI